MADDEEDEGMKEEGDEEEEEDEEEELFGEESRDGDRVAGTGPCATGATRSGQAGVEEEFGPDITGVINGESDWPRTKGLGQGGATGAADPGTGPCAKIPGEGALEEEGEIGSRAKGLVAPQRVSRREREEHNLTHTPFRSWCDHCVRGRGMKLAHRAKTTEEKEEERSAEKGA